MAALAGFGALRHLDLDLFGADKVAAGHAEPPAGHLLDGAAAVVGRAGACQALVAFAAFAAVGLAVQPVHGDGQRLVRFLRDGAVGHGPGLEMLHERLDALHLFQRHAVFGAAEGEQPAQKAGAAFVDTVRKLAEQAVVAAAHGFLQQVDGLGVVAVGFAPAAQLVPPERGQRGVGGQAQRVKRAGVRFVGAAGDVRQRDAADAADGAGEVFVNDFAADAQRLEQLAALVGLQRRDAHLGRDLDHALQNGCVIVLHGGVVVLFQQAVLGQFGNAGVGQIGVDRARAVAQKGGEVVHLARFARFQNQRQRRALFGLDQVLVHGRHRQQRGDGDPAFVHAAVGQNQHVGPVAVGFVHLDKQVLERRFERRALVMQNGHADHAEAGAVHRLDF